MAIIQTETRFGILASHLLWHIERRLTLVENPAAIRRAINGYLPFEEYIAGAIEGKPYSLTMWREDSQTLPATTDSNAKERPSD